MKQVYNPYLPFYEYIPDGEPHVFGDRVYVYGSHDKEGGEKFCMLDYVVWSAPVDDLSDWRYEGVSYKDTQDPDYGVDGCEMYAPDVVQGPDGRFYLYYAMAGILFTGALHVAVSDSPAGPFVYYGAVQNPDGSVFTKNITFDPGVLNDNGRIWLYYGWSLNFPKDKIADRTPELKEQLVQVQMKLFSKSEEEIRSAPCSIMGANVVELERDMLTVKSGPHRIVPGQLDADGTSFEDHAFFEASSMRKIEDTYYYIYSSQQMHELCYATSRYPDRDFVFGGTLISHGDIGLQGRTIEHPVASLGNNHGSVECINGKWYIFYHRQTHGHSFSRQGCAEEITLLPDGRFVQSEITSCGLNGGPLEAKGTYSAMIACQLYNSRTTYTDNARENDCPYLTNQGETRFAANITEGTRVGFKYFAFSGSVMLSARVRGTASGALHVRTDNTELGTMSIAPSEDWTEVSAQLTAQGKQALYLDFTGSGRLDLLEIIFA